MERRVLEKEKAEKKKEEEEARDSGEEPTSRSENLA